MKRTSASIRSLLLQTGYLPPVLAALLLFSSLLPGERLMGEERIPASAEENSRGTRESPHLFPPPGLIPFIRQVKSALEKASPNYSAFQQRLLQLMVPGIYDLSGRCALLPPSPGWKFTLENTLELHFACLPEDIRSLFPMTVDVRDPLERNEIRREIHETGSLQNRFRLVRVRVGPLGFYTLWRPVEEREDLPPAPRIPTPPERPDSTREKPSRDPLKESAREVPSMPSPPAKEQPPVATKPPYPSEKTGPEATSPKTPAKQVQPPPESTTRRESDLLFPTDLLLASGEESSRERSYALLKKYLVPGAYVQLDERCPLVVEQAPRRRAADGRYLLTGNLQCFTAGSLSRVELFLAAAPRTQRGPLRLQRGDILTGVLKFRRFVEKENQFYLEWDTIKNIEAKKLSRKADS